MDFNDLDYDKITELLNKRDEEEKKERRKKKDWISRLTTILCVCSWVILIAVWVVLETASPERGMRFTQTFFQVHFGVDASAATRTRWNYTLIYVAYVSQLICLGSCAIALLLNKMRMKRKGDKYKISIFVVGGITIIAFIVFLIRFGSVIF